MQTRSARRVAATVAVLSVAAFVLSACGDGDSPASSRRGASGQLVSVVASTNVYGDIVEQVAGDLAGVTVEVTSIINDPSQDPHSYEASATTRLALSKADLVIENGGGYDDFVDTLLGGDSSAKVINVVELSGRTAPPGQDLNEHVWYDLPTIDTLARRIAEDLGAAAPANAADFTANAAAFTQKVAGLQRKESAIKAAREGAGVAITEPVPLYLLQASGLVNKTPPEFSEAIENGTDVPAAVLNQTLGLFGTGQIAVLAYNEQTAGPQTQQVLDQAKADQVGVVPMTETLPEGKDYISWMASNLDALSAALG